MNQMCETLNCTQPSVNFCFISVEHDCDYIPLNLPVHSQMLVVTLKEIKVYERDYSSWNYTSIGMCFVCVISLNRHSLLLIRIVYVLLNYGNKNVAQSDCFHLVLFSHLNN